MALQLVPNAAEPTVIHTPTNHSPLRGQATTGSARATERFSRWVNRRQQRTVVGLRGAFLRINAKSCAQLPIALPQELTKSGPRRTATTPKKGVSGAWVFTLRDGVGVGSLGTGLCDY